MSGEESPIITVTFQTVLNRNLIRITDAFYEGDLWDCYSALKITIGLLKQQHRNPIVENELAHIEAELNNARKISGVDLYWKRHHQKRAAMRVLADNLYGVFLKLMDVLHKHGYLEKKRRPVEEGKE